MILLIYCYTKDICKWNLHFENESGWWGRAQWRRVQFGAKALIHQQLLSTICAKSQHSEEGKQHVSIIMKTVWPRRAPERALGTPGSVDLTLRTAALHNATSLRGTSFKYVSQTLTGSREPVEQVSQSRISVTWATFRMEHFYSFSGTKEEG